MKLILPAHEDGMPIAITNSSRIGRRDAQNLSCQDTGEESMGTAEKEYRVNIEGMIVEETDDQVIEEIITHDRNAKKEDEILVFEKETATLLIPNRA